MSIGPIGSLERDAVLDGLAGDVATAQSGPPVLEREVTMADLQSLMMELQATAAHIGTSNRNKALFSQCGWWLANLANQVIVTRAELAKLTDDRRIIRPGE